MCFGNSVGIAGPAINYCSFKTALSKMSGTDYRKQMLSDGPVIVLVNPQLGENIGTAIRAMTNFGLTELRLVNPRDGWPSEPAKAAAAGADHVVAGARVFETLEEALHDLSFVYATSARNRDMLKPVKGPGRSCGHFACTPSSRRENRYIVWS